MPRQVNGKSNSNTKRRQTENRQQSRRASGPTTARGEETRQQILQAARTVFERDGYFQARVADIADLAAVAHGSFYSYFSSKEAAFLAVAAAAISDVLDRLNTPTAPDLTPLHRIRDSHERYMQAYRRHAKIIGILEQVVSLNAEFRRLRLDAKATFVARAARGIASLQDQGLADHGLDPDLAAEALALMVDRVCYMRFVLGQEGDEEAALDTLSQLWAGAIGLKTSPPQASQSHRHAAALSAVEA